MKTRTPDIKTSLPGKRAKRIIAKDRRFTSSSYIKEYPLVIERGRGAVIEDVDGNRFLDFMAGIAVNITGYSHPRIVRAVKAQSERFFHLCSTDFYYESFADLAERLVGMVPIEGEKSVFFTNSGAEAVETAIKLVRYSTQRPYIISFLGAFHGRTMGALSLTASKAAQRAHFSAFLPGVHHVPYGYCLRCPYNLSYSSCGIHCAEAIEKVVCRTLMNPREIAAIFVEPIQGEGGYIVPPPEFLRKLRAFASRNGILLVVDEIQSGMGRTGKWFAIEHWNVTPDIITTAKALASGLPIGATIAREEIMDWEGGSHANTFGGNPVACSSALAVIDIIKEEKLMENATRQGAYIMKRLREMQQRYPIIGDVRGKGLMIGVEFVKDPETKEPAAQESLDVMNKCFKRGLVIITAGKCTMRISPPLIITRETIDTGLELFEGAVKEVNAGLK